MSKHVTPHLTAEAVKPLPFGGIGQDAGGETVATAWRSEAPVPGAHHAMIAAQTMVATAGRNGL